MDGHGNCAFCFFQLKALKASHLSKSEIEETNSSPIDTPRPSRPNTSSNACTPCPPRQSQKHGSGTRHISRFDPERSSTAASSKQRVSSPPPPSLNLLFAYPLFPFTVEAVRVHRSRITAGDCSSIEIQIPPTKSTDAPSSHSPATSRRDMVDYRNRPTRRESERERARDDVVPPLPLFLSRPPQTVVDID
jgi:hypothetical protein